MLILAVGLTASVPPAVCFIHLPQERHASRFHDAPCYCCDAPLTNRLFVGNVEMFWPDLLNTGTPVPSWLRSREKTRSKTTNRKTTYRGTNGTVRGEICVQARLGLANLFQSSKRSGNFRKALDPKPRVHQKSRVACSGVTRSSFRSPPSTVSRFGWC